MKTPSCHPLFRGTECRAHDANPAPRLYYVAILFRVMSVAILLLMVTQVALGVTSAIGTSYGVLLGEAIRLVVFAGILWAAGDVSDVFVKSHCDILAIRLSLAALACRAEQAQTSTPPAAETHAEQPHDEPQT